MDKFIFDIKEYKNLQKKLDSKADNLPLNSPEVVELSQKIDKYIIYAMEKINT